MNLWMTTVFTNADICTVGTCFTVDDTMSYLGLLWRRMIRIKISWIKTKENILYGMFEYTPVAWESELNFNYSEALLVRSSNITIIGDSSKIEALYKEYNTKYPTKDRKIEETISEPEMGFYFKF